MLTPQRHRFCGFTLTQSRVDLHDSLLGLHEAHNLIPSRLVAAVGRGPDKAANPGGRAPRAPYAPRFSGLMLEQHFYYYYFAVFTKTLFSGFTLVPFSRGFIQNYGPENSRGTWT